MAEPAAALGHPAAAARRGAGSLRCAGDPRPPRGRLPRPRRAHRGDDGLRSGHLRPRARADASSRGADRGRSRLSPRTVGAGARAGQGVDARPPREAGVPCPRNAVVATPADVEAFGLRACSRRRVAGRTARGSGSSPSHHVDQCAEAFAVAEASGVRLLAEELVDFRRSSALAVRSPSGQAAAYPVVESVQRDGICHEVVAPAPDLDPALAGEAQRLALLVAGEAT